MTKAEFTELSKAIADLREDLASWKSVQELVKKHDTILGGNGNPGLKTDMALLKRDMARMTWLGGGILLAVIVNLLI